MIPAKPRRRYKPYAHCKLRGHLLTAANRRGTNGCLTCMAIRNERPFCPRGHPLIPGNTYPHRNGVRCCQCQRDQSAKYDAKHGHVRIVKQPKNEQERWEKILRDFGLGMGAGQQVGASKIAYGDVPVAMAERAIVHLRYPKGHKRPILVG
jgi:hypothetical protein